MGVNIKSLTLFSCLLRTIVLKAAFSAAFFSGQPNSPKPVMPLYQQIQKTKRPFPIFPSADKFRD